MLLLRDVHIQFVLDNLIKIALRVEGGLNVIQKHLMDSYQVLSSCCTFLFSLSVCVLVGINFIKHNQKHSLRKHPTSRDATSGFPAKWRLRNERRKTILLTRHYPDLGSASDWMKQISTNQNHYPDMGKDTSLVWNSSLVSQTPFLVETRGGVEKCRLFSQASRNTEHSANKVESDYILLIFSPAVTERYRKSWCYCFASFLGDVK